VIIKYFADIRGLTGRKEQQWTKASPTLGTLLADLAREYGPPFEKRIFEGGQLSNSIIILINGQNIEHLSGLETSLGPEDIVVFFPMVAGG
jgi:molybdopterin synthase sulfur carrier subunit